MAFQSVHRGLTKTHKRGLAYSGRVSSLPQPRMLAKMNAIGGAAAASLEREISQKAPSSSMWML